VNAGSGSGCRLPHQHAVSVRCHGVDGKGHDARKQRLEGGRNGIAGDAETLSETELSIPITATPKTPGEHDVIGSIHFGICKSDACLTRKMPVSFTVVTR
jgi:hypothetical protein